MVCKNNFHKHLAQQMYAQLKIYLRNKIRQSTIKMKRVSPATREMRKLQSTTHNLIPRSCIERVVKDAIKEHNNTLRVTEKAVKMIHAVLEDHIVKIFRAGNHLAKNNKRDTLVPADLKAIECVMNILKCS